MRVTIVAVVLFFCAFIAGVVFCREHDVTPPAIESLHDIEARLLSAEGFARIDLVMMGPYVSPETRSFLEGRVYGFHQSLVLVRTILYPGDPLVAP